MNLLVSIWAFVLPIAVESKIILCNVIVSELKVLSSLYVC